MNLFRPRLKKHFYYLARGRAAHDGIVKDDDALSAEYLRECGQLRPHSLFAHVLFWSDECAVDVAVLRQTHLKWDAERVRVAYGRSDGRLGHGNDDVGLHGIFLCKLNTEITPHFVDQFSQKRAVGAREVYKFKNVEFRVGLYYLLAPHALFVDDDHLTSPYLTHKLRTDGSERARFRGNDMATVEGRERERADAATVTYGDERVARHNE